MTKILLLGDSLTEWHNSSISWSINFSKIFPEFEIINKAISGMDSTNIYTNINSIISENDIKDIKIAIILVGTNDCLKFIDIDIYKLNLMQIIHHIYLTNDDINLILITPPICLINNINPYADIVREISNKYDFVELLDLHDGNIKLDETDLKNDKIHLNLMGNIKLLNNVKNLIKTKWPQYITSLTNNFTENNMMETNYENKEKKSKIIFIKNAKLLNR